MRLLINLMLVCSALAADYPPHKRISLSDAKGSFDGQLRLTLEGPRNKAKALWDAEIVNSSLHHIFRAVFCVKAIDSAGQPIRPGGDECLLRLTGTNWAPSFALNFKGNQNVKLSEDKAAVQLSNYQVSIEEVFDEAPNIREASAACPLVWSAAIRTFANRKFRPTVMDKESYTATFAYDGGRIDGYTSRNMLKEYTNANTRFLGPIWESFRIDAASVYLRQEKPGSCTIEVKMAFAGFGKPFLGRYGWFALDSTFNFERAILKDVDALSKREADAELTTAIKNIPETSKKDVEVQAQITITSEPSGAEIEVNGEFIGNTPTTLNVKQGSLTLTIKKSGYQLWQRSLKLNAGDKRTLQAELLK